MEYKTYHENGQLSINSVLYKDGKFEYKRYDYNGQLRGYGSFKNDKRNGETKGWYGNGQFYEHCYYKDGRLDGECKLWNASGQLYEHSYYIDDRLICNNFQLHKRRLLFIRKKLIERYKIKRIKFIKQYIFTDLAKLCVTFI